MRSLNKVRLHKLVSCFSRIRIISVWAMHLFFLLICLSIFLLSCVDEIDNGSSSYIVLQTRANNSNINKGDPDNKVDVVRIMAFDQEICISNEIYNTKNDQTGIIQHKIDRGTYKFVFIANEPQSLGGILTFAQLNAMAFPASAFNSEDLIPMITVIDNVSISAGNVTINNESKGGSENNPWLVSLDRMGVSLEFTFKSERILSDSFQGLSLSQLPDKVPLFPDTYNGSPIIRSVTRDYDILYFEDAGITESGMVWSQKSNQRIIIPANPLKDSDKADDSKAVKFTVNLGSDDKNRSAFLHPQEPEDLGYSLPHNIGLNVTGHISESLVLSIEASEWSESGANWQAQNHYLNVSDISVKITDYNGARITFSSNMQKVYVMKEAMQDGSPVNTENIFNDLVNVDVSENNGITIYSTSRFKYAYNPTTQTGSGYMDILLDEFKIEEDDITGSNGQFDNFTITLRGENPYGGGIQRDIKVATSQYGLRFNYNSSGQGYVGAFFSHNQIGERVITGQLSRMPNGSLREWKAWIEEGEDRTKGFILSTSPSFDPTIGTDSPGKPENYIVTPNEFKGWGEGEYWENKDYINKCRGRIYFRIGVNGDNTLDDKDSAPVYAKLFIVVQRDDGGYDYNATYIRQGEAPDYIYENGENISGGDLNGQARTHSRKMSPYNLTAQEVYTGTDASKQVATGQTGIFVDYPTQAGAFFQWGLPDDAADQYKRVAYRPTGNESGFPQWYNSLSFHNDDATSHIAYVWDKAITPEPDPPLGITNITYIDEQGAKSDLCPDGYHRPSDGYTDQVATNGVYPNYFNNSNVRAIIQPIYNSSDFSIIPVTAVDRSSEIAYSEFRQSLYLIPRGGDGSPDETVSNIGKRIRNFWLRVKETETTPDYLAEWETKQYMPGSYGLYADGFFDRRPIKKIKADGNEYAFSVSSHNGELACRGYLIVNQSTNASVFFPAAGRRGSGDGGTNGGWCGSSGYYFSSSSGPVGNANTPQSAWSMNFNTWPEWCYPIYHLPTFGQSVRCVKDE